MAKLPWFKFYPNDWLSDEALRSCSTAARGFWIDLLSLMHKSGRRGYLLVGGKPPSHEQLARMTGCSSEEASSLLAELVDSGTAAVSDDGTVSSRRMVRDGQLCAIRSDAGQMGGFATAKSQQTSSKTPSKTPAKRQQNSSKHPSKPLTSNIYIRTSGSDSLPESSSSGSAVKTSPSTCGYKFKSDWPKNSKGDPGSQTRRDVFEITQWFSVKITAVRTLSLKAGGRIHARLLDYTTDELRQAIDNYAASDWIKGGGQPKTVLTFFSDEIIARELKRTDSDTKNVGEEEFEKKRSAEIDERARARQEQNAKDMKNAAPGALKKLAAKVLKRKD